jgi:poly-gamma-glutamate synthesis protein (capsule biosynthesis protein)
MNLAASALSDKSLTEALNDKYLWFYASAACHERWLNKSNEITMTAIGDSCFGTYPEARPHTVFDRVYEKHGSDINYVFKNCLSWFKTDDYTVMNNESAVTSETKHEIKPWALKSKPEHVKILPVSGIEAVNLANNHTKDYLEVGFKDTMKAFDSVKVDYFDDQIPLIKTIGNIEFVFLGYDCRSRLQNEAFLQRILSDVRKYKTPDRFVIVNMHWGHEYRKAPAEYQVQFGHAILDAGADMIWGAHPHILEGVELYKGKYILYSMGDFAFGGDPDLESRLTCMFRMTFAKEQNKPVVKRLWVVPCYENSDGNLKENNYQPLPLFGKEADNVVGSLKDLGKLVKGGVLEFEYFNPF